MHTAQVATIVPHGAELRLGSVEVAIQRGLPDVRWVGVTAKAAQEHTVRIRTALVSSGYAFPMGRVSIKVEPATSMRTGYDLPVALALLVASGVCAPVQAVCFGELRFSGELVPSPLLRPLATVANQVGKPWLAATTGMKSLKDAAGRSGKRLAYPATTLEKRVSEYQIDALQGHQAAKRVVALAIAGRHHLFLTGPPGYGKSALAEAAGELLPVLTDQEENVLSILEIQRSQVSERTPGQAPYRAPHHTLSMATLLGGYNPFRPGELSLASYGLLFLDELPLVTQAVAEGLREPLETKELRWGGLQEGYRLPACPIVFAAGNPCACGKEPCVCTARQRNAYQNRISNALLDRFPMHLELDNRDEVTQHVLVGKRYAEAVVRVRSFKGELAWTVQADQVMARATDQYHLSYRAEKHARQVARTIALFDEQEEVNEAAVLEGLQYRVRTA